MLLSTETTYNFWGQKWWFLYCAVLLCTLSFEVRYKPAPPSQWDSEGVTGAPHVKACSLGPAVNPLLFPFGNYGCYICQSPDIKMRTTLNMHSRRVFSLFRALLMAYGSSQARGQIKAAGARLCHGHCNTGSGLHVQPMLQLVAMPDP